MILLPLTHNTLCLPVGRLLSGCSSINILMFDNVVYQQHGYANRDEYLAELKEQYGAPLVEALTSMLPESEDFDGLISELEDNAGLEL